MQPMASTVSCGILVFNGRGELLLGHATGASHWDIPKGVAEPGEAPREAAVREASEEMGLRLSPEELADLGRRPYRPGKDLHLFAIRVEGIEAKDCACTSLFVDRFGRERPEMDRFAWVPWTELPGRCAPAMARVLATIDPGSPGKES
jgi:8-oxo-dGTP pyrophosphatase MutT (NUDIX family)